MLSVLVSSADGGKVAAVVGEGKALDRVDVECEHGKTPAGLVFPNPHERVLPLLARSQQAAVCVSIKAADWRRVAEVEFALRLLVDVHGDQSAARSKNGDVVFDLLDPLDFLAFVWRIANDVIELQNRVLVHFGGLHLLFRLVSCHVAFLFGCGVALHEALNLLQGLSLLLLLQQGLAHVGRTSLFALSI